MLRTRMTTLPFLLLVLSPFVIFPQNVILIFTLYHVAINISTYVMKKVQVFFTCGSFSRLLKFAEKELV